MTNITSPIETSVKRIRDFYPTNKMLSEMLQHILDDCARIETVVQLQEEIIDELRQPASLQEEE